MNPKKSCLPYRTLYLQTVPKPIWLPLTFLSTFLCTLATSFSGHPPLAQLSLDCRFSRRRNQRAAAPIFWLGANREPSMDDGGWRSNRSSFLRSD